MRRVLVLTLLVPATIALLAGARASSGGAATSAAQAKTVIEQLVLQAIEEMMSFQRLPV